MTTPLLEHRLSRIDELPGLLDALQACGEQAGWDAGFQMQLALVIEELVVNALTHGGQAPGQAWAQARVQAVDGGVEIEILDNGQAFDPLSAATPDTDLDLDARAIGGLGIHLVRQMTQGQRYQRQGGLNQLRLFKASAPF